MGAEKGSTAFSTKPLIRERVSGDVVADAGTAGATTLMLQVSPPPLSSPSPLPT
jgi:RNA 3'-terminal phosphate cyclase